MSMEFIEAPFNGGNMRRKDREIIAQEDILAILDKCEIIRIGLCADHKPYIVPMNFAYEVINDKISLYFHSASEGKKLDLIRQNHHVCFEADCFHKILKAEHACAWSAAYASVMGEGEIVILAEEKQKIHALDALLKRYGFTGKPHYHEKELAAITALQIHVTSITGKQKV